MNTLAKQPKFLVVAIAVALGFAVLGAGCSGGNGNNGAPANAASAGAMNSGMSAGSGNSNHPVTDTWITTKVKGKLATTSGIKSGSIHVETNNGVVTLTGTVPSQSSVSAVKSAVMSIDGVKRVDASGLHVGNMPANASSATMSAGYGNSHNVTSDTWITTKTLAALQTVNGLNNSGIAVETNNGVVVLSGHVDSEKMKDAAVKEIKTVNGVKSVDTSHLTVGGKSKQ